MEQIADKLIEGKATLAVVGLGYVGLPVAVSFAKKGVKVVGFDIQLEKINSLKDGIDITGEIGKDSLKSASKNINFTTNPKQLKESSFIVVAVPTPIDEHKTPDLNPLIQASKLIGQNLPRGAIIVYESTVYPGVTEEICLPVLEKESGLSCKNGDFFIGYSPERINPGDKNNTLERVVKIVSGQNKKVCDQVASVYEIIVNAGVHRVGSIKVAEAAKVIENTQRDLNIALMNELSIIFEKIGIDTEEVLKAAETKWNFLKFHPGLVGGHCIGVDPYYLTSKAEELGYHPQVVLAGRRINDSMGPYIAQQTIKQMIKAHKVVVGSNILILGATFKENVPDFRNSRVVDIIKELKSYGTRVYAHDPFINGQALADFDAEFVNLSEVRDIDTIILATPHDELKNVSLSEYFKYCRKGNGKPVFIDVRWVFSKEEAKKAGFCYWRV